jgi:hypothetical protein
MKVTKHWAVLAVASAFIVPLCVVTDRGALKFNRKSSHLAQICREAARMLCHGLHTAAGLCLGT